MPEDHSGTNIQERLDGCYDRYDIRSKVFAGVADNGSNVRSALETSDYHRISCFAHNLNLAVKEGLGTEKARRLRSACKHLVKRFKKSTLAKEALQQHQRNQGEYPYIVLIEQKTRWNSTYAMFERTQKLHTIPSSSCVG